MNDGIFVACINGTGTPLLRGELVRITTPNNVVVRAQNAPGGVQGLVGVVASGVTGIYGPVAVATASAVPVLLIPGLTPLSGDTLYVSMIPGRGTIVPGVTPIGVVKDTSAYARDGSAVVVVHPIGISSGVGLGTLVFDSIDQGGTELAVRATTGLAAGTVAFVGNLARNIPSVLDDFQLLRWAAGTTPDGITVINSPDEGAAAQWVRMNISNTFWKQQTRWSVSPATGNNQFLGCGVNSDDAPVASIVEILRRVSNPRWVAPVTIRILDDVTTYEEGLLSGLCGTTGFGATLGFEPGWLRIEGVPTVVATGTLTAGTVMPGLTSDDKYVVEDTGLVVSWTASDCISSSVGGGRMIEKIGTNVRAPIIAQDADPKKAIIGPPVDTNPDLAVGISGNYTPFASGDAYRVVRYPLIPSLMFDGHLQAGISQVDMQGGTSESLIDSKYGVTQVRLTFFRNFVRLRSSILTTGGCCFLSGGAQLITGQWSSFGCTFVGTGATLIQIANGNVALFNGANQFNAFYGAVLLATSASRIELETGTALFWNCSGTLIDLVRNSICNLQNFRGKDNTGFLINARGSGCWVYNDKGAPQFSNYSVTTSQADPYRVGPVLLGEVGDLPLVNANASMGITGSLTP